MKQLYLLIFLLSILLHGCIWGNGCEPDCGCDGNIELYIDVQPALNPDSEVDEIDNATAYFFSASGRLDSIVYLDVADIIVEGRPIIVNYGAKEPPIVVVWSNFNGTERTASLDIGSDISEMWLKMGIESDYALSTGNLYHGMRTLNSDPVQHITLTPQVGRLSITVLGIENISNIWQNLYFTITTSYSGYDFYAVPLKESVVIRSAGEISGSRSDFVTPDPIVLTLYPAQFTDDEAIEVRLHQITALGETVLAEADMDVDGNWIVPHAGRNTNVLIDMSEQGYVGIYVRVSDWDVIEQWSDW